LEDGSWVGKHRFKDLSIGVSTARFKEIGPGFELEIAQFYIHHTLSANICFELLADRMIWILKLVGQLVFEFLKGVVLGIRSIASNLVRDRSISIVKSDVNLCVHHEDLNLASIVFILKFLWNFDF